MTASPASGRVRKEGLMVLLLVGLVCPASAKDESAKYDEVCYVYKHGDETGKKQVECGLLETSTEFDPLPTELDPLPTELTQASASSSTSMSSQDYPDLSSMDVLHSPADPQYGPDPLPTELDPLPTELDPQPTELTQASASSSTSMSSQDYPDLSSMDVLHSPADPQYGPSTAVASTVLSHDKPLTAAVQSSMSSSLESPMQSFVTPDIDLSATTVSDGDGERSASSEHDSPTGPETEDPAVTPSSPSVDTATPSAMWRCSPTATPKSDEPMRWLQSLYSTRGKAILRPLWSGSGMSRIRCAAKCLARTDCSSMAYNSDQRLCQLGADSGELESASGWIFYSLCMDR